MVAFVPFFPVKLPFAKPDDLLIHDEKTEDPTLAKGKRTVDELGAPPRQTAVRRLVYDANGELLYDNTWRSVYAGEPSLVRVGSKEPPKKPRAKPADTAKTVKGATPPASTTTAGAATQPTPATPTQP